MENKGYIDYTKNRTERMIILENKYQKQMQDWSYYVGYIGGALAITFMMLIVLSMALTSAYPYQLLENGTIVDLATGDNVTDGVTVDIVYFNGSIYLVPYQNKTLIQNFINQTNNSYFNITNVTCYNCSYYYLNNTNFTSTYNKSDIDFKISDINTRLSALPTMTDLNDYLLITNFTDMNLSVAPSSEGTSNTILWILVIISLILSALAIYFANSGAGG